MYSDSKNYGFAPTQPFSDFPEHPHENYTHVHLKKPKPEKMLQCFSLENMVFNTGKTKPVIFKVCADGMQRKILILLDPVYTLTEIEIDRSPIH